MASNIEELGMDARKFKFLNVSLGWRGVSYLSKFSVNLMMFMVIAAIAPLPNILEM